MFRGSVHFPEYWLRRNGLQGMDFKAWSLLLGRSFDPNFCPNLRWNFTQGCVLKLWIDRHISRDKVYMPWIKSKAFIHEKKNHHDELKGGRKKNLFPCICSVIDHRSDRSDRSDRSQITDHTDHIFGKTKLWCLLWSITELTHPNMEFLCFT